MRSPPRPQCPGACPPWPWDLTEQFNKTSSGLQTSSDAGNHVREPSEVRRHREGLRKTGQINQLSSSARSPERWWSSIALGKTPIGALSIVSEETYWPLPTIKELSCCPIALQFRPLLDKYWPINTPSNQIFSASFLNMKWQPRITRYLRKASITENRDQNKQKNSSG